MNILAAVIAIVSLIIAVACAYYFGVILEEHFGVHNTAIIAVLMIASGIFVWWVLGEYVLPAVGVALGWDRIAYVP